MLTAHAQKEDPRGPTQPPRCALQRDQTVPKAALQGGTPRPAGQTQPSPLRREPETLFLYGQARLRSFVNLIENESKPWESRGGWMVAIGAACAQRGAGWARWLLTGSPCCTALLCSCRAFQTDNPSSRDTLLREQLLSCVLHQLNTQNAWQSVKSSSEGELAAEGGQSGTGAAHQTDLTGYHADT